VYEGCFCSFYRYFQKILLANPFDLTKGQR